MSTIMLLVMVVVAAAASGTPIEKLEGEFGKVYHFQSKNYPAHRIRQRDGFEVWLDENNGNDTKFILVQGLAKKGGVSLRSFNYPNRYLRHRNSLCYTDEVEETELFKEDASFIPHQGLATNDSLYMSLQPVNYPSRYLRHYGYRVRIDDYENNDIFRQDASWLPLRDDKKKKDGEKY